MDKNLGVETQSNFTGGNLKPWAQELLLQWAALDPVSKKEIDRNNAAYLLQHNRNPFIDYPELAEMIFGSNTDSVFSTSLPSEEWLFWRIFPNPATDNIYIQLSDIQSEKINIEVFDIFGRPVLSKIDNPSDHIQLNISSLPSGLYLMKVATSHTSHTYKIVKQ